MSHLNLNEDTKVSHTDIYHKLGIVEGKIDSLMGIESRIHDSLSDQNARIRDLERFRWMILGVSAAIAGIVSFVMWALEVIRI